MKQPLILFGAGASWGSEKPGGPPLGTALFDALARFSPGAWGSISASEAADFKADSLGFENAMKKYADSHSTDGNVDILQRAMADFFFNVKPCLSGLYIRLARWIKDTGWKGSVATLNYERLLQFALTRASVGFNIPGLRHASGSGVEICLPHGNCNIFIPFQMHGIVAGAMNLKFESASLPEAIDDPVEFQRRIHNDNIPPIMCYFQPDKDLRAGGTFIRAHRQRLVELVASAYAVAIIGVKVREHDAHIWGPLSQTSGRIVYCAGEEDAKCFNAWAGRLGRRGDRAIPAYWEESFDEICSAITV